jgi:hypothetical protein
VAGIVHDDVEPAIVGDDLRDRRIGRGLRRDVDKLKGRQCILLNI